MSGSFFLNRDVRTDTIYLRSSLNVNDMNNIIIECKRPRVLGTAQQTAVSWSMSLSYGTCILSFARGLQTYEFAVVDIPSEGYPLNISKRMSGTAAFVGSHWFILFYIFTVLLGLAFLAGASTVKTSPMLPCKQLETIVQVGDRFAAFMLDAIVKPGVAWMEAGRSVLITTTKQAERPARFKLVAGDVMIQNDRLCKGTDEKECVTFDECILVNKQGSMVFGRTTWFRDNCTFEVSPVGGIYVMRSNRSIEFASGLSCEDQFRDIIYDGQKIQVNCNKGTNV